MSWANQRVYEAVQTLPVASLASYVTNQEFNAARILRHIVEGAEWYVYCMTGEHQGWQRKHPETMDDVQLLAAELREFDALILAQSGRDDEMLAIQMDSGETDHFLLSSLLAQATHHATEHRAQLVDALELRGFKSVNLDDLDLWSFEVAERPASLD